MHKLALHVDWAAVVGLNSLRVQEILIGRRNNSLSLALIFAHTRIRNVDLILCRSSSVWRGCKGLVKTSLGSLVGYIFMRCFVGRAVEILSCLVKGLHVGPIYLVHPLLVLGCEVKVFVEAASSGPCSWICRGLSGAFNAFYYFSSF